MDGYPSGQRGLTVNQFAEAFGGSNPSPSTVFSKRADFFWGSALFLKRCAESSFGTQFLFALIAQLVEHSLGKTGVMGSNPIQGSFFGQNSKFSLAACIWRKNGEAALCTNKAPYERGHDGTY